MVKIGFDYPDCRVVKDVVRRCVWASERDCAVAVDQADVVRGFRDLSTTARR